MVVSWTEGSRCGQSQRRGRRGFSVAQESQLTRLRRPSSCYTQGPSQLGARGITLLRTAGGICAAASPWRNQGIFLGTPQKFPRPRLSYPRGDFSTFLSSLVCCDCAVSGIHATNPSDSPTPPTSLRSLLPHPSRPWTSLVKFLVFSFL